MTAQTALGVAFLNMPVGSRAQAMGGAYTGIAREANGIHYNPAGMGFGAGRELMLYHAKWFEDISIENLTFLFPFSNRFSMGASFSYLHLPEMTRYDIDPVSGGPLETGSFSVYDMVAMVGTGMRLSEYLSAGANIKFFQEGLDDVRASGIAVDIGLLSRLPEAGLSMGIAVQHLGPGVTYLDASERLPLTYRAGIAFTPPSLYATIAVDVVKTRGRDVEFLPGMEFNLSRSFFLRGGYQVQDREGQGFTAGFGLQLMDQHKINYVYVPYGDLGDTHRAELIFHLGYPGNGGRLSDKTPVKSSARERARKIANLETPPQPKPVVDSAATIAAKTDTVSRKPAKIPVPEEQPVAVRTVPTDSQTVAPEPPPVPARLLPPSNVQLVALDDAKMKITWKPTAGEGVTYNIYARQLGGSRWIKLTPTPIVNPYQTFNRKKSVQLELVVTAIRDERESDFSPMVILQ